MAGFLTRFWPWLIVPTLAVAGLDDQLERQRKDLDRVKRELQRKNREERDASRLEKELTREVSRVSGELKASRRDFQRAEKELRDAERSRAEAERRLAASRMGAEQWRTALARDFGEYHRLRAGAPDGSFLDQAYRRALLRDKAVAAATALRAEEEEQARRDDLAGWEEELAARRGRMERERRRAEAAHAEVRRLHDTVRGRRALLAREIEDLAASAEKFEKLIVELIERQRREELARAAAAPPEKRAPAGPSKKGRLPWPVEGAVTGRFGRSRHAELDTYVFSNGVRLRPADKAAAVRSVDKGEVLFAGEFMSYGLMALVAHGPDLHSIYAHLGQLKVAKGEKVSVGQSVGLPGKDDEGRPLVYFELRADGAAVDPLLWLK